jgi:hypothetical protein
MKRSPLSLFLPTLAVVMTGCNLCSKDVIQEVRAPEGVLAATWYVRNCGATTDFSTLVSVHRAENSYTEEADLVFVAKGKKRLRLEWASPHQLSIACEECGRNNVFKEVTKFGDVEIQFRDP